MKAPLVRPDVGDDALASAVKGINPGLLEDVKLQQNVEAIASQSQNPRAPIDLAKNATPRKARHEGAEIRGAPADVCHYDDPPSRISDRTGGDGGRFEH